MKTKSTYQTSQHQGLIHTKFRCTKKLGINKQKGPPAAEVNTVKNTTTKSAQNNIYKIGKKNKRKSKNNVPKKRNSMVSYLVKLSKTKEPHQYV